jgi:DNA-binding CsgD family transcriptional regulator
MSATIWQDEDGAGGAMARGLNFRSLPSDPASAGTVSRYADLVAQLTDGQRDCLRLVYNHLTSKDIARILTVSPHTVDMRLRTSMKVLGVASRIEAARLLVQEETRLGLAPQGYQPLIYQSPDMEISPISDILDPTASPAGAAQTEHDPATVMARQPVKPDTGPDVSGPPRAAFASVTSEVGMLGSRSGAAATDPGLSVRPLAGSLPWGERNTLSIGARLSWIAGISIGSALAFGAILSALSSLKSLL